MRWERTLRFFALGNVLMRIGIGIGFGSGVGNVIEIERCND